MSLHTDGEAVVICGVPLMDTQRRPIHWSEDLLQFFTLCERAGKRTTRWRRTSRYIAKGGVRK